MHSFNKSAIVPYTSQEMYSLVNNIKAYPEFLPWCSNSVIHSETPNEIQASLTLQVSGFSKAITTHNRMEPNKIIEIRLINEPMSHLEAFWRFEPATAPTESTQDQDGDLIQPCKISFNIEFEFTNRLIRMALEPFFNKVSDTIVDAFSNRAALLYKRS